MKRRRKRAGSAHERSPRPRRAPGKEEQPDPKERRALFRVLACGAIFVSLIALKLVMPDNLTAVRGTLGSWLVRDADFSAAFSALGQTLSGKGAAAEKLGEAYTAVFGEREDKATEVSGEAEIPADSRGEKTEERVEELPFPYSAPLAGAVTSPYGWREHPSGAGEAFHSGVDLAAEEGEAIACFADGTVGVVGRSTELGHYLTVTHADGYSTLYAHCSRVLVSSGSGVRRGEILAEAGSTGNATGPHLHFELHRGNEYLDPAPYLSGREG